MKGPTKRQVELGRARVAGYHNDTRTYVRGLVERRTASGAALAFAWNEGARMKAAGVPCTCRDCQAAQGAV